LNEYETRSEHITPALKAAGWGVVEGSKIEYEFAVTSGRIMGAGKPERKRRLASLYQQKLAALDALKKSLLHQAFSGRLGDGAQRSRPRSDIVGEAVIP
jgi:type I restriction enzyme R subunit